MNENLYSAKLGCYKLKENAKLPTKGSGQAACYDLYSCSDEPILLEPKERVLVPTGLVLDIPRGFSARIHTRSGMAAKKGIGLSVSQGNY
jgi:dUTP pyrophosphatase